MDFPSPSLRSNYLNENANQERNTTYNGISNYSHRPTCWKGVRTFPCLGVFSQPHVWSRMFSLGVSHSTTQRSLWSIQNYGTHTSRSALKTNLRFRTRGLTPRASDRCLYCCSGHSTHPTQKTELAPGWEILAVRSSYMISGSLVPW